VEAINDSLRGRLHLDGVFTCYHDDRDACGCRKPAPGLIVAAAARHQVDVGRSFMVGDRWRDVAAGRAAGCTTFLVRAPYSERERCRPDHEVGDLAEAAREILRQLGKGEEG
jgi:D-glycero-D-manno-heptose 1,7-bisphosphate phosphatase